jgi:hypothetical protein
MVVDSKKCLPVRNNQVAIIKVFNVVKQLDTVHVCDAAQQQFSELKCSLCAILRMTTPN